MFRVADGTIHCNGKRSQPRFPMQNATADFNIDRILSGCFGVEIRSAVQYSWRINPPRFRLSRVLPLLTMFRLVPLAVTLCLFVFVLQSGVARHAD